MFKFILIYFLNIGLQIHIQLCTYLEMSENAEKEVPGEPEVVLQSPPPELENPPPTEPILVEPTSTPAPTETTPAEPPPPPSQSKQDALNTEFVYYSSVLKIVGPTVSSDNNRKLFRSWVIRLFRPEYQSGPLKEKRNRYLAYLTITMMLDEPLGVFKESPPSGLLPNLATLSAAQVPAADWEVDKMWQETLMGLSDDFQMLECPVHSTQTECENDHKLDLVLDQEFQLFLFMARPYAALLNHGPDKTRVATWLSLLCSIHGPQCCSSMKAIRNDYIMSLLGYLQDLRAVGPFEEYPSWKSLKPLIEVAKTTAHNRPITDPTGAEANEFLMDQPVPDDGAFCYIALTGDLIASSFSPN